MGGRDLHQSQIILGEASLAAQGLTETTLIASADADVKQMLVTQLDLYIDALSLGTHTSVELRFYFQNEKGGAYIARAKQNSSDNTIDDFPAILDSSTPNSGLILYSQPMPSCFGFKVTSKFVGGATGSITAKALGRYN